MAVRGIRGAVTVKEDRVEEITAATQEMLNAIVKENDLNLEDVVSVLFSVTSDIRSAFPATAARAIGWNHTPLMCFQEIEVEGSLPKCIRVLIHINTEKRPLDMRHVYLREARVLRPDLV